MKEDIKNNINCNNKIEIAGEKYTNNIIIKSKLNDLSSNLLKIILRFSSNYKSLLLFRLVIKKMKKIVYNIFLEELFLSKNHNDFFLDFILLKIKLFKII